MLKILTIGGATQDIIIEYKAHPSYISIEESSQGQQLLPCKNGSKVEVERLHYATGGGATNTAVSFKRLGFDVSAFFKIGADQAGSIIVEKLKEEGVTAYYKIVTPTQTGASFIIPSPGKDRIIFAYRGANNTLQANDITPELIAEQDLVYITSLSGPASKALPYLTKTAKRMIQKKGIHVVVNPGSSQLTTNVQTLKAALADIDILILNFEEIKLLMSSLKPRFFKTNSTNLASHGPSLLRQTHAHDTITFSLQDYFKEIFSYGVKRVVVTNGKEGVYVAIPEKIYFHPALQGTVVNTLGAGDAFGSCFTAMLVLGAPIEDAIRAGILQAQSVISYQDAKTGLLTTQELEKKLATLDRTLLEKYSFYY